MSHVALCRGFRARASPNQLDFPVHDAGVETDAISRPEPRPPEGTPRNPSPVSVGADTVGA